MMAGRRTRTMLIMALFLLSSLLVVSPTQATDPFGDDAGSGGDAGDQKEDAVPIDSGYHRGDLTTFVDHRDWYTFEPPAGMGVQFNAWSSAPLHFAVYDAEGRYQFFGGDGGLLYSEAEGPWHLQVMLYGDLVDLDLVAPYLFTLEWFDPPAQDDAGSGRDAGGHPDASVPLPDGSSTASIGAWDNLDTFSVDVPADGRIEIMVSDTVFDAVRVHLRGAGQGAIASGVDVAGSTSVTWQADDATTVHVYVSQYGQGPHHHGEYTLDLQRSSARDLPDLDVGAISVQTETDPVGRPMGDEAVFSIEVRNHGAGDAAASILRLNIEYEDEFGRNHVTIDAQTPAVAAGGSVTVEVVHHYGPILIDGFDVRGQLDRRHHVQETDEDNNHFEGRLEAGLLA